MPDSERNGDRKSYTVFAAEVGRPDQKLPVDSVQIFLVLGYPLLEGSGILRSPVPVDQRGEQGSQLCLQLQHG